MTNLVGRVLLGRYRVDAFLGRGGMAEVYRAWDARRSVYVALKVLNADLAEDPVFLRRFAREARALELLQHPHIVRFFGFEESESLAFLVMEYIDGHTLRRQLKLLGRPLTLSEALTVLGPVCSALHYAHGMGVYHRDIKPGNIFIERGGRVVLGDFGIAHLSDSTTVTYSTPGTPAYMAPEQCEAGEIGPWTDVYGLGITAYEMLTLDRPFKGDTEGTTGSRRERVRWEQMNMPPPRPRALNPEISPRTEGTILQALSKDPARRQQGAQGFYNQLSQGGVIEPAISLPWRMEAEPAPPEPPSPPPADRPRVPTLAWGALGAAVLLFLAVMGAAVVRNGGGKTDGQEMATLVAQLTAEAWTVTWEGPTATPAITPTDSPPTSVPNNTSTSTPVATFTATPNEVTPTAPSETPTPASSPVPGQDLVRLTSDSSDEYVPSLSPGQDTLVFMSDRGGTWQIYTRGTAGASWERLTRNTVDNYHPRFSPDGGHIIYASEVTGDWELYTMAADGTKVQRLTYSDGMDVYPWYLPDGSGICFMSRRRGTWGVYVMDIDGERLRSVIDTSFNESYPSPAPDGKSIVYQSDEPGNHEIYVISIDGGSPRRLTYDSGRDADPVFSPDGRWIVFETNRDGRYELYAMDAQGDYLVNLTQSPSNDWVPSFSPDGQWVLFQSDRHGSQDIFQLRFAP